MQWGPHSSAWRLAGLGLGLLLTLLPARAGITFRAASSSAPGVASSSVTVAAPAGLQAGDVMLAQISQRTSTMPFSASAVPAGWLLLNSRDDGSSIGLLVYFKLAGAAEPASYSWTLPSSGRIAAAIAAFDGVDPVNPVNASATRANGANTNYTAPNAHATAANTLWVALFAASDGNTSVNTPAGMTAAYIAKTLGGSAGVAVAAAFAPHAAAADTGTIQSLSNTDAVSLSASVVLRAQAVPLLDLRLDEWVWSAGASLADSSGNGLNGTLSSASSAAPAKLCNGATLAANAITVADNPLLQFPNDATFMFWVNPSANVNRILLARGTDYYLYLNASGKLVLGWGNAGGTALKPKITSVSSVPLNTWTHLAVRIDNAADKLYIHFNGSTTADVSVGKAVTLGVVANPLTIAGVPAAVAALTPTLSAYAGILDEVKLFGSSLSGAQINAIYANELAALNYDGSARVCPPQPPDHYELVLPSSGVACLASTVSVLACANSSSPCTSPLASVDGMSATLSSSAGTLGATSLVFNASGLASTTLSYPGAGAASVATVTLSGEQLAALSPRQCCPNGVACAAANACSQSFSSTGFIIAASAGGAATTLPTLTAGAASTTYYLRAVKTSTTTQACEAALSGANSVNWALQCLNPSTCSAGNRMTLTGSAANTIASNPASGVGSSSAVAMTFDANGNAPFSLNYADAGQVMLWPSKAAAGALQSALAGSSNAFVVKPASLALSAIKCSSYAAGACATSAIASPGNNPAAANPAGLAFMPAGKPFSATVTALDALGNATPNFGREASPEGVTLAASLVTPVGGVAPALSNASAFGSFSGGAATGSTFAFNEVGIIRLSPSLADGDYLGAGSVAGTTSANVGRFVPHHFDLSVVAACGAFSYAGQPFSVGLTARNGALSNDATQNYSGASGFARAVTLADAPALGLGSLGGASVVAASFVSGLASASPSYSFSAKQTAPQTLVLRASDSDGVSSAGYAEGNTPLRSGRLRLASAFGRANAALQVPVSADYWSGNAWLLNSADNCTSLPAAAAVLSNPRGYQGSTVAASSSASAFSLVSGSGLLSLSAPTPAGSGITFDLALNLGSDGFDQSCQASHPGSTGAALTWLRSNNGACSVNPDRDPAARVSFGVYSPETRKVVHVRELF